MPCQCLTCHDDGDVGKLTDGLHSIKSAGDWCWWGMELLTSAMSQQEAATNNGSTGIELQLIRSDRGEASEPMYN